MEVKFYRCRHCGNLVMMVRDSGVNPVCCGQEMELLVAASQDASVEKHVPQVSVGEDAVRVEVGAQMHPMTDAHYIEWVCLAGLTGVSLTHLEPGDGPVAVFPPVKHGRAYAYCNLHGLWEARF